MATNHEMLVSRLAEAVKSAKSGEGDYLDFFENETKVQGENQMLLFMKPELTENEAKLDAIGGFVLGKVGQYRFSVENGFVLSGGYLRRNGIMSAHYGIINAAAHKPEEIMTAAMWEGFEAAFGVKKEQVSLVGAVKYLESHPDLDAAKLSAVWLERGSRKLGSGVYCQPAEGGTYLVNGFYPRLLEHFTKAGACIACFILRGLTSWRIARNELAGATAPEKAAPGSIRNGLLARKEEFGLLEISPNLNGVHLSAGPVEGVVEILRFSRRHRKLQDLVFGRMLVENFSASRIDAILSNAAVATEKGQTTYFDLTEEQDSEAAIRIIRETAGS